MAHAVGSLGRVLEEDRVRVFAPVGGVHGVGPGELELGEAVVAVVRAGGAVDEKVLAGGGVDELLWPFVGREALVAGPAKRRFLPVVAGGGQDLPLRQGRGDGVGVVHSGDAEVGGPAVVLAVPARVDVVELRVVPEVGAVNGELVVGVEFGLVRVGGRPWIGAFPFDDKHAVVNGWAVVFAPLWVM